MAEAALQRSVLTIFCHPLGCSSSSAAHLPSLPPPRSLTSCYCWQSQRGQMAHTDTHGSVNLLLGHALALEGHTTLVSPVSLPLPTAPAQDHFTATPRHSWLMSPPRRGGAGASVQSPGSSRCLEALCTHSATASTSLCGGRPRITDTEPRHAAPRYRDEAPRAFNRGSEKGVSARSFLGTGVHSLPHRHIYICLFH